MMKGLSGTTENWIIGVFSGIALMVLMFFNGCIDTDSGSPREDANQDCEEAWVVEYDGDDETVNETAILDQDWCQEHLNMVETEQVIAQEQVQQDQVEEVQAP